MTSAISFKSVLQNLRENAFINSAFPVLLSIEMHCSAEQQKIMAQMFKEILKDIYTFSEKDLPELYPSPNKLKRKFIIKEAKNLDLENYENEKVFFEKIDARKILKRQKTETRKKRFKKRKADIAENGFKRGRDYEDKNQQSDDESERTEIIENDELNDLFNYDESLFNEEMDDIRKIIIFCC